MRCFSSAHSSAFSVLVISAASVFLSANSFQLHCAAPPWDLSTTLAVCSAPQRLILSAMSRNTLGSATRSVLHLEPFYWQRSLQQRCACQQIQSPARSSKLWTDKFFPDGDRTIQFIHRLQNLQT